MSDHGAFGFEVDFGRFRHHQQVNDVSVETCQFVIVLNA